MSASPIGVRVVVTRGRCLGRLVACAVGLVFANEALACAVCFGDPKSDMAKGAVAGVWVLVSVVGFVLVGMAGTGLYWMQRSRSWSGREKP